MNRLDTELHRLYPAPAAPGQVRAMVLELARPASWEALSRVWQGVQAELELPAPAIAVSGVDGYQLWFSLAHAVPAAEAANFLEQLRRRYLADIAPERLALHPFQGAAVTPPPVEARPGNWSAFLAQDLAALFVEEPWLDLPPGLDQQAELLSRLTSIKPAELGRALARLLATPEAAQAPQAAAGGAATTPKAFLLEVMNDRAAPLALRIEAAKALLPYLDDPH
ncbi:MAG: hypothetical protein JWP65_3184 [Ramlibacter sp.]|jgi:hypothetical protein|uniref:hypothetical protein n=1 Tax=Ramlibacter sp. TaxID=1917967 RepID=UPI00260E431E|nr:hypothetical protein [Ramlibacter sp.]MDB5752763.1 hypothetical protein [Ramlibacter sp.]